jgi:hypothetical protein
MAMGARSYAVWPRSGQAAIGHFAAIAAVQDSVFRALKGDKLEVESVTSVHGRSDRQNFCFT